MGVGREGAQALSPRCGLGLQRVDPEHRAERTGRGQSSHVPKSHPPKTVVPLQPISFAFPSAASGGRAPSRREGTHFQLTSLTHNSHTAQHEDHRGSSGRPDRCGHGWRVPVHTHVLPWPPAVTPQDL